MTLQQTVASNVDDLSKKVALTGAEYAAASVNLGEAKTRWESAKEALSEAEGNWQNYLEEVGTEGLTAAQEE